MMRPVLSTIVALFLDFLSGSLDSRVGFSRGTNATMVDSTGRIIYAPANLLLRSEEFDNAAWTKLNATVTANTTTAPDGTLTADTLSDGTATDNHGLKLTANPALSTTYAVSVFAKMGTRRYIGLSLSAASSGSLYAAATFDLQNGVVANTAAVGTGFAVVSTSIQSAGNGWYRCTAVLTFGSTGILPQGYISTSSDGTIGSFGLQSYTGTNATVFLWGAQLEPVTYQTAPGPYAATTASAYYGPRFDYNPLTLGALGLLVEEQRTNLLLRSQEFDQSPWSATRATVSANVTAAPDGTATADKLVEDTTATSSHFISQSFASHTSGVSYTLTVYAKAAERSQIRINGDAAIGLSAPAVFNLSDGSVVAAGSFTATISNAGNGWYRCVCTGVATATGTGVWVIGLAVAGNTTYTGDGTSGIFIWGAQLEAFPFASSYIPTVASQVTRNADAASMTGTNFSGWYNQTEGTFVAGADCPAVGTHAVFAADDGTASNTVRIRSSAADPFYSVRAGGVEQANLDAGTITANTAYQQSGAYAANNFATSLNGATVVTDTSGSIPTVSRLALGADANGNYLNGHIRQITYFNTRLPNAQLETLSSPSLVPTLVLDFTASSYASGY